MTTRTKITLVAGARPNFMKAAPIAKPRHSRIRAADIWNPSDLNTKHSPMITRTKITLVAGARPNFMKVAPIIRELRKHEDVFDWRLVHTGQHYDHGMNGVFLQELGIPGAELSYGRRRWLTCRANRPHHGRVREVL